MILVSLTWAMSIRISVVGSVLAAPFTPVTLGVLRTGSQVSSSFSLIGSTKVFLPGSTVPLL